MDREALVIRNRSMADAFHSLPIKHVVRRGMLQMVARAPNFPFKLGSLNRILLIRPDHLGDVLLSTPAIHALRAALPRAEIHALAGPWSARILANYPEIDLVLTVKFPGFSREPKADWRVPYQMAFNTARRLRRVGYSSAVIMRPDHWWGAMVTHIAGIPQRIGYDLPDTTPFLTDVIPYQHEHAVLQNLRLMEQWTGQISQEDVVYRFPSDSIDRGYVDGYLQEWGIAPEQPIFCVHPGSGTWVKQWEIDRWAEVADILTEQLDAVVIFTGRDTELAMVRRITERMSQPFCITAGETSVGQLAALFSRAKVVLGPDSGPLHLAAAVDTPTVTLFGPADPIEFGSWGSTEKHKILTSDIGCRPCRILDWADDNPEYHPCLRDITVGQVLDAARRVTQGDA